MSDPLREFLDAYSAGGPAPPPAPDGPTPETPQGDLSTFLSTYNQWPPPEAAQSPAEVVPPPLPPRKDWLDKIGELLSRGGARAITTPEKAPNEEAEPPVAQPPKSAAGEGAGPWPVAAPLAWAEKAASFAQQHAPEWLNALESGLGAVLKAPGGMAEIVGAGLEPISPPIGKAIKSQGRRMTEAIPEPLPKNLTPPKLTEEPLNTIATGVAGALPVWAGALLAGGSTVAGAAVPVVLEATTGYNEAKDAGASEEEALWNAGIRASVNAYLMSGAVGRMLGRLDANQKAARPLLREIATSMAEQGATFSAMDLWGTFSSLLTYAGDAGLTWADLKSMFSRDNLERYGTSFLVGAAMHAAIEGARAVTPRSAAGARPAEAPRGGEEPPPPPGTPEISAEEQALRREALGGPLPELQGDPRLEGIPEGVLPRLDEANAASRAAEEALARAEVQPIAGEAGKPLVEIPPDLQSLPAPHEEIPPGAAGVPVAAATPAEGRVEIKAEPEAMKRFNEILAQKRAEHEQQQPQAALPEVAAPPEALPEAAPGAAPAAPERPSPAQIAKGWPKRPEEETRRDSYRESLKSKVKAIRWPRRQVTLQLEGAEPVTVEAYSGPPGIIIHRRLDYDPQHASRPWMKPWVVVHEASSLRMLPDAFETLERAKSAAVAMSDAADWTLPKDQLLEGAKGRNLAGRAIAAQKLEPPPDWSPASVELKPEPPPPAEPVQPPPDAPAAGKFELKDEYIAPAEPRGSRQALELPHVLDVLRGLRASGKRGEARDALVRELEAGALDETTSRGLRAMPVGELQRLITALSRGENLADSQLVKDAARAAEARPVERSQPLPSRAKGRKLPRQAGVLKVPEIFPKPKQPHITFSNPAAEAWYRKNAERQGETFIGEMIGRVKDMTVDLVRARRPHLYIPQTEEFATIDNAYRWLDSRMPYQVQLAQTEIARVINPLSTADRDLMQRHETLADLAARHKSDPENYRPPSPAYTPEYVEAELQRVNTALDALPHVRDAIAATRAPIAAIRDALEPALQDLGLNAKFLRVHGDDYLRHAVAQTAHFLYTKNPDLTRRSYRYRTHGPAEGEEQELYLNLPVARAAVKAMLAYDLDLAKVWGLVHRRADKGGYNFAEEAHELAKSMNDSALDKRVAETMPGMTAEDVLKPYRQKIAMSKTWIADLALKGELNVPGFEDYIEEFADAYREHKAVERERRQEDPEGYVPTPFIWEHPQNKAFMQALLEGEHGDATIAARTFVKAIQERRELYQKTLGEDYIDPASAIWTRRIVERLQPDWTEALVPHSISDRDFQVSMWTLPERLADAIREQGMSEKDRALFTEVMAAAGYTPEKTPGDALKRRWVPTRDPRTMLIPIEIARTMDARRNRSQKAFLANVTEISLRANNLWKELMLVTPHRIFKYTGRNFISDNATLLTFRPQMLAEFPDTLTQLVTAMYGGAEHSPRSQAIARQLGRRVDRITELWIHNGGFQANSFAQEVPEGFVRDLRGLARPGVLEATVKELGRMQDTLGQKRAFELLGKSAKDIAAAGFRMPGAYLRLARHNVTFLESIGRLAFFRSIYKELLETPDHLPKGGFFYASKPEMIRGLTDTAARAYKLANDMSIAYDNMSELTKVARLHAMGFLSYQEGNVKRHYWLMRNALYLEAERQENLRRLSRRTLEIGGERVQPRLVRGKYRLLGDAARQKTAAREHSERDNLIFKILANAGIRTTVAASGGLLRLAAALALMQTVPMLFSIWNKTQGSFQGEDQRRFLPPDVRERQDTIIMPWSHATARDVTSKVAYFNRTNNWTDALEWMGIPDAFPLIHDMQAGIITPWQAAKGIMAAPVMKAWNLITPTSAFGLVKTAGELKTGVQSFPNTSQIEDRAEYIARIFGVEDTYRVMAGKLMRTGSQPIGPVKGRLAKWLRSWSDTLWYEAEVGHSALYSTLDYRDRFLAGKNVGGAEGGGQRTPKSIALLNMKRALSLGDPESAVSYIWQYAKLGGDAKGITASLRNLDPLYGVPKKELANFFAGMSEEQLSDYYLGKDYHSKVALGKEILSIKETEAIMREAGQEFASTYRNTQVAPEPLTDKEIRKQVIAGRRARVIERGLAEDQNAGQMWRAWREELAAEGINPGQSYFEFVAEVKRRKAKQHERLEAEAEGVGR